MKYELVIRILQVLPILGHFSILLQRKEEGVVENIVTLVLRSVLDLRNLEPGTFLSTELLSSLALASLNMRLRLCFGDRGLREDLDGIVFVLLYVTSAWE